MQVTNGTLRYEYEQHHRPGQYLGRHLELDGRSLAYLATAELAPAPIKPAEHVCPLPILDQGRLGSCTGHAGTEALAALYGQDLSSVRLSGLPLGVSAVADEQFAVDVYHEATISDGFPGTYPPDDTGSSGLGVCRALKRVHLISRYTWGTSVHAFALMLQRGGVLMGMPWLEAFFSPDPNGFIDADPHWQQSQVAGGHELYVEALEAWHDVDYAGSIVRFRQSWGASWGDHGYGRMRLSTYQALKAQVDLKQLVR
jgi:hypothetical protein